MDNTEILLVRACKSYFPKIRILSVHRRFYGKFTEAETEEALTWLLANICEKYGLISVLALSERLPLHRSMFELLLYTIRFSEVTKFPPSFKGKQKC